VKRKRVGLIGLNQDEARQQLRDRRQAGAIELRDPRTLAVTPVRSIIPDVVIKTSERHRTGTGGAGHLLANVLFDPRVWQKAKDGH
jgi:hypothetical protein